MEYLLEIDAILKSFGKQDLIQKNRPEEEIVNKRKTKLVNT